jgi:DNA-directed RNA polymerase sigma subunit (sigma70/sigma32)
MTSFWPTDEGWPYADVEREEVDLTAETDFDDDLLDLRLRPAHLFTELDPLEREVIASRFGLGGSPIRSMKQLGLDLGVPRADLKEAMGSGLAKIRAGLQA